MWGPWQVGNMEAVNYVKLAKRWAHAIKLVDPTVKLVGCGIDVSDALSNMSDAEAEHLQDTTGT